jgi:glucose-6-phosphate isomerase
MVDLSERLGVNVKLVRSEGGWMLELGEGVVSSKPQPRYISELKPVLRNQDANTPHILYWMFRDVRVRGDEGELRSRVPLLRYDISLFMPGVMSVDGDEKEGDEFVKAFGHYHPYLRGRDVTFPEVYEVVYGRMLFLLQEPEDVFQPRSGIRRVIIVEVDAMDERKLVVIPPNFGHVAIVTGDEPVVTSNWVARNFDSQYAPFALMRGAAYYIVKKGDRWAYEPNPNYPSLPTPEVVNSTSLETFGVPTDSPIYIACLREPSKFQFLIEPS